MNGRSKKEEMKKSSSWVSYKKRRLKNIDSKRNKNRSGNLISRCFERKEKKKKTNKNKQEREYIHPIQKFLLFPLISTRQSGEPRRNCRNCEIYSRYKRDRCRTLCLNFKILPVDIALSRCPSR